MVQFGRALALGARDCRFKSYYPDMGITSDRNDPRLTHGAEPLDGPPVPQAEVYLVLSPEDLAKGYVRPYRSTYIHEFCGAATTMNTKIAATYAANPGFYGSTYCAKCCVHRPVGENGEFVWEDGTKVGT